MTGKAPSVTVVVPTRDRPHLLEECLQSIAAQAPAPLQVIVVDDGTSDENRADQDRVCEAFPGALVQVKAGNPGHPLGPSKTRNVGIRASAAKYIAFLDDDDVWCAGDHLTTAIDALESTGARFFFGDIEIVRGEETVAARRFENAFSDADKVDDSVRSVDRKTLFKRFRRGQEPHLNCCVADRDLLLEVGLFWERANLFEDRNLVYRLGDAVDRVLFRDRVVATQRVGTSNSIYEAAMRLERWLTAVYSDQYVRVRCRTREAMKAARWSESWHWRELARFLKQQHPKLRGLRLRCLVHSQLARPSLGGIAEFFKLLF